GSGRREGRVMSGRPEYLNIPLTDDEFENALYFGWSGYAKATLGQEHLKKYPVRARYVLAEAMYALATEWANKGRPDKAGRLRWAASLIEHGGTATKRVMGKIQKDIDTVRERLVR